jgi:hypothetical protein
VLATRVSNSFADCDVIRTDSADVTHPEHARQSCSVMDALTGGPPSSTAPRFFFVIWMGFTHVSPGPRKSSVSENMALPVF